MRYFRDTRTGEVFGYDPDSQESLALSASKNRRFVEITTEWPPSPTDQDLAKLARSKRNRLLMDCDWTQLPDCVMAAEDVLLWKDYRQALRDITDREQFPQYIQWPIPPNETL